MLQSVPSHCPSGFKEACLRHAGFITAEVRILDGSDSVTEWSKVVVSRAILRWFESSRCHVSFFCPGEGRLSNLDALIVARISVIHPKDSDHILYSRAHQIFENTKITPQSSLIFAK